MKPWLTPRPGGFRRTLYIQPGARKTECAGEHDGALKIRLAAPPVEGKANTALIAWLAKTLGAARRDVALVAGDKNRHKLVDVDTALDADEITHRLGYL